MSNQTIYLLVALALIAVLILFGVNLTNKYQTQTPQTNTPTLNNQQLKIDRTQVKGIAVEKEGKVYNMSMRQQMTALTFLDRAEPVDRKDYPTRNPSMGFNRLIIYRFNQPDIVLTPFAFEEKNIVFESPIIGTGSYILEMSGGEFYNLIQKVTEQ